MTNQLQLAINAAVKAGEAIMEIYKRDFEVEFKKDASPLTEADREADRIIKAILKDSAPVISEESKALPFEERRNWSMCWMVDPLDGTKEFIKKNGEFTVNIALINKGLPILGVVYLPAVKQLYFGSAEHGSFVVKVGNAIDVRDLMRHGTELNNATIPKDFTIVASRSHMSADTEKYIEDCKEKYGNVVLISKGSSIKLCLVAEGKAHVYPRIAPTMEWDTAAAHAVAKYAGCDVLNFNTGEELTYNKENLLNPYFIVRR